MKKMLFLLVILAVVIDPAYAQTLIYQEGFDGPTLSTTSISVQNNNAWQLTTQLKSNGTHAIHAAVAPLDTTYLITPAINTTGLSFIKLEFSHIAKIEFFDKAIIEYSTNNGQSWSQVVDTLYNGTGFFGTFGSSFNAASYPNWLPMSPIAVPDSTWWVTESFDLSKVAGNNAQVKIRFALIDVNINGSQGNYGWIIDDIKVWGAYSELLPPTLSFTEGKIHDTVYHNASFQIKLHITDQFTGNSGIDSATVKYRIHNGVWNTLQLISGQSNAYQAAIPFPGFGRTIEYYAVAWDGSPAQNADSTTIRSVYTKYSPGGVFTLGTGTNSGYHFGPIYRSGAISNFLYSRYSYLFPYSELSAAGLPTGVPIQKLEWYKTSSHSTNGAGTFDIYLKNSYGNALLNGTWWWDAIQGATKVYSDTNQTLPVAIGWVEFPVSPFIYTGAGLEVTTDWNLSGTTAYPQTTGAFEWQYTTGLSQVVTIGQANLSTPLSLVDQTYGGKIRPNLRITLINSGPLVNDLGVHSTAGLMVGMMANTPFPLSVHVKNYGTDTIYSGIIHWMLNGALQPSINLAGSILPVSLSNPILLNQLSLPAGSHHLKIWTSLPNGVDDYNILNDTLELHFQVCHSQLTGSYTIGGSTPDFATLTAAVDALNHCGVSGPVIMNISSGIYTEQILLKEIPGASAVNTITFRSAGLDSTLVEIHHQATSMDNNHLMKLEKTTNITFSHLTFVANDTMLSRLVAFSHGNSNIRFTNNVFTVVMPTFQRNENKNLIQNNAGDLSEIELSNNLFRHGSAAIALLLTDTLAHGITISGNTFENNSYCGIDLFGVRNFDIMNNTFSGKLNTSIYKAAIVEHCAGIGKVGNNKIVVSNAKQPFGIVVSDCSFDSTGSGLVYNNFISLHQNHISGDPGVGIDHHQSCQIDYVYNSVYLYGNQQNSAAIRLVDDVSITNNVHILNNIFTNESGGFLVIFQGINPMQCTLNHNNYYNYGGSRFNYIFNNLSSFGNWKSQTGYDSNSDTLNPMFISTTDLHVFNVMLNGRATPYGFVTTDIDGELRHPVLPDIGADEFNPQGSDLACIGIISPVSSCGLASTELITLRIVNMGSVTVSNFLVGYSIDNQAVVTQTILQQINPGDTTDITMLTPANLSASSSDIAYSLKGWIVYPGDVFPYNDTTMITVISGFVPPLPTFLQPNIPYGQSATLNVTSSHTTYWWDSIQAVTPFHAGTTFITPLLFDTTTYYLSTQAGTGIDTIQIGTGTQVSQALPMEPYYGYSYSQSIYHQNNFSGKKGWIEEIWYNYTSQTGYGPDAIEVFIGTTAKTQYSNDSDWVAASQLTKVYQGNINIPPGSGWVKIQLDAPYFYSGNGNLVVAFDENTPGYHSSSDDFYCTQVGTTQVSLFFYDDNLNTDPANPPSGITSQYRPNIRFSINDTGCSSSRIPLTVSVTGFPSVDAGVSSIISPTGATMSGVATPIRVSLKNYGLSPLTSASIVWEVNGQPIDTMHWAGTLSHQDTAHLLLHSGYSFAGGINTLMAKSYQPNNQTDLFPANDAAAITFSSCVSGIYTIGDTITGNAHYGSFNGALAGLRTAGICGDVVFQIAPGVYTEQLLIDDLNMINQTHSITFQGATGDSTAVRLAYTAISSTANYTLKISNSNNIIFQHIHIKALSTSNGGGVMLTNNASNNLIESCIIESSVGTSANLFLVSFDQASRNIIRKSTLKNCHTALTFLSNQQTPARGNQILNNAITGFRSYGVFAYYEDSLIIRSNTFQSDANASGYGLRLQSLGSNVQIINNKILLSPTTGIHAIYNNASAAISTGRGLIANNFIIISSGSSITNNGIYSLGATNYDYFHNSVHITSAVSSGRGLMIAQGSPSQNCNFVNNILRVPTGYGAYISASDGIGLMNNNVYYTTAANKFYVGGSNRTTFAAYQTAFPKESQSMFHDPDFVSGTDLHLTTTYLRSFGTPLPTVKFDIDDEPRGALMVAPGADEPPLQPIDLGVVELLNIVDTTYEGTLYPLQARVLNYGTDTVYSFDIQYQINNGLPVLQAINTVLPPSQTALFTLPAITSGTGHYTLCVKTIVLGDTNAINDSYCSTHFGVSVKDASIKRILTIDEFCGMTNDTLRVVVWNAGLDTINGAGQPVVNVSYQSNTLPVVTETFTTVLPPGDSVMYEFTNLVYVGTNNFADSTYHLSAWISYPGDSDAGNDTAHTMVTAIHVPATPVANSPVQIPFGTSVTLTASSPSGDSLLWYNQPQGTKIGAGTSYTTPVLTQQDTFFVQAGLGISTIPGSLPTLYAGGNSFLGAMFNIQAINQITIDSFAINAQSSDTVEVWYRPGSYLGYTTSNAGWTLMGKHAVISSGSGNPTSLPVGGLTIPAGQTYGIYVTFKTGSNPMIYSNGNGSNQNYQNSDLLFTSGHAGGYFSATSSPRVFNGTIHYHREVFSGNSCLSDFKPIVVVPAMPSACDVGVVSVLSPDSSVFFSDEETVTISVYNYGTQSQINFPVSYQIDQGPVITESFNLLAFPSALTQFTFTTKADLSSLASNYTVKAFTGLTCDTTRQNDTAMVVVAQKSYCVSKSNSPLYHDIVNVAFGNWSHSSNPTGNMYSDYTQNAYKPNLIKEFPTIVSVSTGVVPPNSYPYPGWINLFIDYNQDGVFSYPDELVLSKQANANTTVTDTIQIPATATTGVTRMRVVFREDGTHLNTGPCGVYDFGETEDYFVNILPLISKDAGITEIYNPLLINTVQSQALVVKIANFGFDTLQSLDVHLRLNANPVQIFSVNQTILPQQDVYVTLGTIQLAQGHNDLQVYTVLAGDVNPVNDSISKHVVSRSFFNLPYSDDFEGPDHWIADTTNVNWGRGIPTGTVIDSAYSPVQAWVTKPEGSYLTNAKDVLFTPQFRVINGADSLIVSFWHHYHTATGQFGGYLQASVDSGNFWFSLGYMGHPTVTNWYNSAINGIHQWSGNSGGWVHSTMKFDYAAMSVGTTGTIMFRFVFAAGQNTGGYEGWAIDNFELRYPQANFDAGVVAIDAPSGAVMLGSTQDVVAVVVNHGLQPLSQIPVEYAVNGANWITEICSPSTPLNPGDSLTYHFLHSFSVPYPDFQLCVRTQLPNDPYTFNDQVCKTIPVSPAQIDAGLKHLLYPIDTTILAVPYNPSVVLVNAGLNTLTTANMEYRIDAGTWVTETWNGSLGHQDTFIYTFATPVVATSSNYKLHIRVVKSGDINPVNDTLSVALVGVTSINDQTRSKVIVGHPYPNPVDEELVIPLMLEQSMHLSLRVSNALGQMIHEQLYTGDPGLQEIRIQTSAFPQGVYYLTLAGKQGVFTKKFIVNR
jgi:hypothetical protein